MNFDEAKEKIVKILEESKFAVLATAAKSGAVDTAQMCIVNDGLTIYMQTDSKFDKVKNLRENPNVAVNLGAYNFFGKAKIVGHPTINSVFIEKIKAKYLPTYESYTNLKDETLIEITLETAKIWGVDNKKSVHEQETIMYVDFKNRITKTVICDKM